MIAPETSRSLLRRGMAAVMVCNPFLLLSPMCLLYGIYRAVVAPNLFASDTSNTVFNFVALTVYVLMVCVTATLLARKSIVPDTVMLVLLSGMLFVAPFILIAHGVFLPGRAAVSLGVLGCVSGLAQLQVLRRRLPETFVSRPLYLGGVAILLANFAGPMIFRHGLETDNEAWGVTSGYAWLVVLPLLVGWLNFLPATGAGSSIWARAWFAPCIYLLWLAGTVVQLWTVAYVDDRHLHFSQFTIALWVLAWTCFRRANLLPSAYWIQATERAAIVCAILLPGLGALNGLDIRIASALYVLNVPLFARCQRLPVIALAGLSAVGALCCMPLDWVTALFPTMARVQFTGLIVAAAAIGALAFLRDARAGFLGAVGVAVCVLAGHYSDAMALNAAILFLFLHQLRWPRIDPNETWLLTIASGAWIIQTLSLELQNPADARAACFVATIVAVICLRHASLEYETSLVPPIASIAILLLHPTHWTAQRITAAPSGVLPIIGGFVLLAIGAWTSTRHGTVRTERIDRD